MKWPSPRDSLLLAPVRGWFPLLLPVAALAASLLVLWLGMRAMTAQAAPPQPAGTLADTLTDTPAGGTLPARVGLLEEALTASGLYEPGDLQALVEAGVWLALPGGPFLARMLDPELRLALGLRGKLSTGGPFTLPGQDTSLLKQASPAAEALLRRCLSAPQAAEANG